jgi:hypothetical protein
MTTFIQNLRQNWHAMRIIRLVFGLFAAQQAYELHDPLLAMISVFFVFQAMMNTGCGAGGCNLPPRQ